MLKKKKEELNNVDDEVFATLKVNAREKSERHIINFIHKRRVKTDV